jgi:hypothetical protein
MTAAATIRFGVVTVLVAALGVLAACGGGGSGGGPAASTSQSASAMTDDQIMAIARELGECMRNHGYPSFRDGRVENGRLLDAGPPKEAGIREIDVPEACVAIDARIPQTAVNDAPPSAAELAKMTRFSQCMRQHGLSDFPDPNSEGRFPMSDQASRDFKSDKGIAAKEACKQFYDGQIRGPRS